MGLPKLANITHRHIVELVTFEGSHTAILSITDNDI